MKQIFSILFKDELNLGPHLSNEVNLNKRVRDGLNSTLISLIFLLLSSSSYCQFDSLEHKYFNNDSIQYDIILVSHSALAKENSHISKHYIRLRMSKDYRSYLLEKNTIFWLERLRNKNSDWATNLILYYLYDRDASPLIVFNERKKWLKIKEDDIKYWENFLSISRKISQSSTKKLKNGILCVLISNETISVMYSFTIQV